MNEVINAPDLTSRNDQTTGDYYLGVKMIDGVPKVVKFEYSNNSGNPNSLIESVDDIEATLNGNQGNATQLTGLTNNITTSVNAGDSVKLLEALQGRVMYVRNSSANQISVYPASGEKFSTVSIDGNVNLAPEATYMFVCIKDGVWSSALFT
jgi:hypothetical protein